MMLLEGLKVSKILNEELKKKVDQLKRKPRLEIILVGDDPASLIYVNSKVKTQSELGMVANLNHFKENSDEDEIYEFIQKLNNDDSVDGILLQLPVPKHMNQERLMDAISYKKDVDGFHTMNQGLLFQKREGIRPATPKGIMMLLDYYGIDVQSKHVVIIGRSQIVGAPLSKMFLDKNATVTITHSKTKDLPSITKQADILVAALGKPKFVTYDMVKDGAIVIDVGINRVDGKLTGDVDFEAVKDKVSYITPVPKGVGPMTICALGYNLYELYLNRNEREKWKYFLELLNGLSLYYSF